MNPHATLDHVTAEPPEAGCCVDFQAMFANDHPVEMEIGAGKGGFLLRQSQARPEHNFFGIEWANKYYLYAADRMCRWGVSNVRLMRTDARHFVIHHMPAGALAAVHIYHPDPWPKKRHHKRRLFQPEFVESLIRSMKTGARLAVQTDHADYFDAIRSLLDGRTELTQIPFDDPEFGKENEPIGTNFEVKYVRQGRKIYRLAFVRGSEPAPTV